MFDTAQTGSLDASDEGLNGPAEEEAVQPPIVCAGICASQLSPLLPKALASLVLQKAPRNRSYCFFVTGPAGDPRLESMVEAALIHSRFPIRFLPLEPGAGLAEARNRVLAEALASGAEWITFLGEDETAPPGWLLKMVAAARRYKASVVQGPVISVYPEPRPFWAAPDGQARAEGEALQSAAGRNVLWSAALLGVRMQGAAFDPSIVDEEEQAQDFFIRAARSGARIVYSGRSAIRRVVVIEDLKLLNRMWTALRNGHADICLAKTGSTAAILQIALAAIFRGAGIVAAALVFLPFDRVRFKTGLPRGAQRLCHGAGMLAALTQLRGKAIFSARVMQTLRKFRFR